MPAFDAVGFAEFDEVRIADEIGDAKTSYWLKESAAHINGMWRVMKAIKSGNIEK